MRSDAYIRVECSGDGCDLVEEIELTALARSSWDERNVTKALERQGWTAKEDEDYCEECSTQRAEKD